MTITFRRTKPRLWQGNGFGYSPATYAILQDGIEVGRICYGSRWIAAFGVIDTNGFFTIHRDRLADLKAAVRRHLQGSETS
jgi:hypothetical protein